MTRLDVRRVLFVIEAPPNRENYAHTLPPLGPLGLVSFLESKGISADIVDMNVTTQFPDSSGYDAIGFSVTNANITPTLHRAELLRRESPSLRIFAGGPGVQVDPFYLCKQSHLDALIVGEAEPVLYNYLRASDPGRVPGILVKGSHGRIHHTGPQGQVESLDSLPFPALDRIDFSQYHNPIRKAQVHSSIITSRGCPWRCTFCFHPHGSLWRARSASNVVDEIEWQVKKLGVQEIAIYDEHFTHDQARVSRICCEIKRREIEVALQCAYIRVDCVSMALLQELREAGLWELAIAPESGNPATLQRIRKGFSLGQVKRVREWCKQLGIFTQALFILGFPWEGEAEVNNTIRFAQELDADLTAFTRLTLFPGTVLYDEFAAGNHDYRDQDFFSGKREPHGSFIDEAFLQRSISRAYRSTTLRPRNILRLMRALPLASLFHSTRFMIMTRSF